MLNRNKYLVFIEPLRLIQAAVNADPRKLTLAQAAAPLSRLARPRASGGKKPTRKAAVPVKHFANIYPGKGMPVPEKLASLVKGLEKLLNMSVWLIVQNRIENEKWSEWDEIGQRVSQKFIEAKCELPKGKPIALLLDSPGGYGRNAYQIANLIRKHCGSFKAVVPQYAKSAATLIALGAEEIILGCDAELGPLDAQFFDPGREDIRSALDEVQSLERLFATALEAVDQSMQLLISRTQKKVDTLLAPTLHFVSEMMKPMIEKIDTVHYTQTSRVLKVAEEYATRLLVPQYPPEMAKIIARHLVEKYPEHAFVIDSAEAARFGLRTTVPSSEQTAIFDQMTPFLNDMTIIGKIEEARP